MRHRRADALRNEQAIVRAGAQLLADDPGASMQAIADAAGVSRPTVYRSFPNREALMQAIVAAIVAEAIELVREAADDTQTPAAESLGALIRELGGVVQRYPVLVQMVRARHKNDRGERPGKARDLDREFTRLVRRGHDDGSIRTELSARMLQPMVFGALMAALAGGDERDPRHVAAAIADTVLHGMRPRAGD